jgi:hypothetical protein
MAGCLAAVALPHRLTCSVKGTLLLLLLDHVICSSTAPSAVAVSCSRAGGFAVEWALL